MNEMPSEHPSKRLFRLIPGLNHACFAGMRPATAKVWLAVFSHAIATGKMLPNGEVASSAEGGKMQRPKEAIT